MEDPYDMMVEYLTENPEEIRNAWLHPMSHKCGPLFGYASGSRELYTSGVGFCGCLTQIRSGNDRAATGDLTAAIRLDERVPSSESDINTSSLLIFAEWQRRIDAELNRTPPVWND